MAKSISTKGTIFYFVIKKIVYNSDNLNQWAKR